MSPMQQNTTSVTSFRQQDVNRRLEDLALSALFSRDELIEIRMAAEERNSTPASVIRGAVLDSLF